MGHLSWVTAITTLRPPILFVHERMEQLILAELSAALGLERPAVLERWIGTYAYSAQSPVLVDAPQPRVRLVLVTSAVGASIGFALADEVVNGLLS
jgi:hypothetical protein